MRTIDIEALLKWAYRDELPKAGLAAGGGGYRSGWSSMTSFIELLTKVDDNKYGVVPLLDQHAGDPHPDAIKVHEALIDLDRYTVELPDGWNPMPELGALGEDCEASVDLALDKLTAVGRDGARRYKMPPSKIVFRHAIGGDCPGSGDFDCIMPARKPVTGPDGGVIWFRKGVHTMLGLDGAPIEHVYETEDGWDKHRKQPKRGAYRKYYLDPDPVPAMVARGEYEYWHACLGYLVEALRGALDDHEVTGPARPSSPWIEQGDGVRLPRILEAVKKRS